MRVAGPSWRPHPAAHLETSDLRDGLCLAGRAFLRGPWFQLAPVSDATLLGCSLSCWIAVRGRACISHRCVALTGVWGTGHVRVPDFRDGEG